MPTRLLRARATLEKQYGQATTEYVVCIFILAAALFVPIHDDQSALDMLINAFRKNHADKIYVIGHPAVGAAVESN